MCGIAGFWTPGFSREEGGVVLRRMTDAIRHRGPDDEGQWLDPEAGIALGHRRLSILDLSAAGHQPMASASGRFLITFNGEIYNWQELRQVEADHGARWRGHSDTEVLLAAIERRGLVPALQAAVGMFAFALWDRQERRLSLGRDRLGEKPLYWGWVPGALLFGSELKALRAHPNWRGTVEPDVVALYLRHNCVPAPYCIYKGVQKLLPGTLLHFCAPNAEPEPVAYWSAREAAIAGLESPLPGTADDQLEALDQRLRETVRQQMVADVPLGAFLSGGIDSSLIVALMQAQSRRPVRTFTIGFHEPAWNEAGYAEVVARHLGTEHTELYLTPADALAAVPELASIYDEPFADSSQIPTCLVARLARQHVTVSLSGDGGDELFGGYGRYPLVARRWRLRGLAPRWLRVPAARAVRAAGGSSERLGRLAGLLAEDDFERFYLDALTHWRQVDDVVPGIVKREAGTADPARWLPEGPPAARMMHLDAIGYLPDDILVKVDRATMAVGLESRAPLLDHRVVELAWRLPASLRVGRRGEKVALRRLLARYVPPELTQRPKRGFSVPLGEWLRGPLRDWAADLLDPRSLRESSMLDPAPIERKWRAHLAGRNSQHLLWDVLMYQAWARANTGSSAT